MKIFHKLLLGFMSMVLIIGVVGFYTNQKNHLMAAKLRFIQEGSTKEALAAANLAVALHASYSGAQEYVEESLRRKLFPEADEDANEEIEHAAEKIISALEEVTRQIEATREATLRSIELAGQFDNEALEKEEMEEISHWHENISKSFAAYRQATEELIAVTKSGDLLRAAEMLEEVIENLFREDILPLVTAFQGDSRKELEEETMEILESIENVQLTLVSGVSGMVAFAIALSFFLARRISIPLERLSHAANNIQRGHAVEPFQSSSRDEISQLTTVFFEMVDTELLQRLEIEKARRELEEHNTLLERTVADRTSVLAATNVELNEKIVEHQTAEKRLAQALDEKETMLKEIHHRVKNNMQIISSLLQLQMEKIEDPQVKVLMRESESRIRSLALVHEKLYQSENLASIDLGDYIDSLSRYLLQTYSNVNVALQLHIEPLMISLDKAIPCGLILNESITNTLKHAFESGHSGQINITLKGCGDNSCSLRVADNGKGLPAGFDWTRANTLGMQLIDGLANQMGAKLNVTSDYGTAIELTFSLVE
jgi:two-component sensor histidine kinase/HAMP domain-containing protein